MNADRFLEEQSMRAQMPKAQAAAKKASPYARARSAPSSPATPVPDPATPPGQTQPDFYPSEMLSLPRMTADPSINAPIRYPGLNAFGMEDTKKLQADETRGSQLDKTVYQSPEEFLKHQNEVMSSPAIEGLMSGANQEQELAKNFLEAYPQGMTDMSSVMGLADYLAKGKGHAQASYKRPASYEEIAGTVSGLLSKAQQARQRATQLGMEEAGPLKSGQTGISDKQEMGTGRETGYKIPHPPMMNPFQVLQGIGGSYEKNPRTKEINDEVKAANDAYLALQNPSWLTDSGLKGSIIRSMGVNRITQNELQQFGGGSPDLWNRAQIAIGRLTNGQSLSASDRHTIEEFASARLRAALSLRDQLHQDFQATYGGFAPPSAIGNVTKQGDVQPLLTPRAPGDSDANAKAFADKFFETMKGMK